MNEKIGITTTEFGFGPVSKSLYIIEEINEKYPEIDVVFYGDGFSKEYIDSANVKVEIRNKDGLQKDRDVKNIINVMDTDSLAAWECSSKNVYFVDSLAWMWDKPVDGIEKIKKYFVQDYLVKDGLVEELSSLTEVNVVAPITRIVNANRASCARLLLVNFSGVHNPFTKVEYFTKYCSVIAELILRYADGIYDEIVFSLNSEVSQNLEEVFNNSEFKSKVSFGFFGHDDFLNLLCRADRVITNPGITTTLELLSNDCAFAYLFGSNYSQCLMTHNYKVRNGLNNVFTLDEFGFDMDSLQGIPEESGVKAVSSFISNILDKIGYDFEEYIRQMLIMPREELLRNNSKIPLKSNGIGQETIVSIVMKDMGVK